MIAGEGYQRVGKKAIAIDERYSKTSVGPALEVAKLFAIPDASLVLVTAHHHYARAVAFAATKDTAGAQREIDDRKALKRGGVQAVRGLGRAE